MMVIDLHYLPSIPFLSLALKNGICRLEAQENYQKGSFRNRAHIATANGPHRLSIPLRKGKNEQMPVREVQIAYEEPWQKQHWGAIRAAYSKSPYFEFYADDLQILYDKQIKWLFDWNFAILEFLVEAWELEVSWEITETFQKDYPTAVLDLRNQLKPKSLPKIVQQYLQPITYTQVFKDKHGFIPNLSSLDLLFCTGPEGTVYLMK